MAIRANVSLANGFKRLESVDNPLPKGIIFWLCCRIQFRIVCLLHSLNDIRYRLDDLWICNNYYGELTEI